MPATNKNGMSATIGDSAPDVKSEIARQTCQLCRSSRTLTVPPLLESEVSELRNKSIHQQNSKTHTKVKNSGDSVDSSGIPVEFDGIPWHSMPILFPNPECPDLRNSMEFHQNPLEFHWNPLNSIEFHRNAPEFTGIHRILYFLSFADVHPIAFWSRKCIPAECNYDIHDRE